MSYFINPVAEDQCVYVSYEGEVSATVLSATRSEVKEVLDQRQWNRIVVDVTQVQSAPKPLELSNFIRELPMQVRRKIRIALLVRPDQARQTKFVETVARRAGLFLTYFLDPEKAMAWLAPTRFPGQVWPDRRTNGREPAAQTSTVGVKPDNALIGSLVETVAV